MHLSLLIASFMETADNRHFVESQPVIVLRFQILPPELVSRTRAELSGLDPTTMIIRN